MLIEIVDVSYGIIFINSHYIESIIKSDSDRYACVIRMNTGRKYLSKDNINLIIGKIKESQQLK